MKVVLTGEAEHDLETIGDHIARDNPARASSFVNELIAKAQDLADVPFGYPLVPRYENSGVRRRVYRAYLIFYRIQGESIEILRILHGAQDYEAVLFTGC